MFMYMRLLLMLIAGIALAVFWIVQFTFLMALDDTMFSTKHDKVLWCTAFIFAAGLTPFAFLMWKKVQLAEPS